MLLREQALRGDARATKLLFDLARVSTPKQLRWDQPSPYRQMIKPSLRPTLPKEPLLWRSLKVRRPPPSGPPPSENPRHAAPDSTRAGQFPMNDQAALAALLRSELSSFVWKCVQTIAPGSPFLPNWHIDAIVCQLMRVHGGEISRLLINQPPRSLKSISVSVAYVAWLLGHDPTRRVIVASYNSELAAELHRQFRMVIDSGWYQAIFPEHAAG